MQWRNPRRRVHQKNDKLDKQIEKETLAIAQMETEQSEGWYLNFARWQRKFTIDLIKRNKQLTRDSNFIRGIKVYNDKRIEIEWNFADELKKYVEQVQKICSWSDDGQITKFCVISLTQGTSRWQLVDLQEIHDHADGAENMEQAIQNCLCL